MSNKYWETEEPVVLESEKNQIRVFTEAGKVQIYPKVASAARGIGRGATIDLAAMSPEELEALQVEIEKAITVQKQLS